MAHYKATRALSEEEGPLLNSACAALTETLCPYIAQCFSQIFPDLQAAVLDLKRISAALSEQPGKNLQLPSMPPLLERDEMLVAAETTVS